MKALARNTDPLTSHLAAERVAGFSSSHRAIILTALEHYGPMTAHEIAHHVCDLVPHQILKRLPELRRMGLIEPTGETRPTGRTFSRVWMIV